MPYSPTNTLMPSTQKKDKLDEMIQFLQDNINNQMRLEQYTQQQQDRQSKQTAEAEQYKQLLELVGEGGKYKSPTMYEQIAQAQQNKVPVDDTRSTFANWLNSNLASEKGKQAVDTLKGQWQNVYTQYPNQKQLIDFRQGQGFTPEQTVREITDLMKPTGGSGSGQTETNITVGQASGINYKQLMRNDGLNIGNYVVYARGKDSNPNIVLTAGQDKYFKNKQGIWWINPKTNKAELTKKVKDKFVATKGANHEVPKDVIDSLNDGYEKWQESQVSSKGKDTEPSGLNIYKSYRLPR